MPEEAREQAAMTLVEPNEPTRMIDQVIRLGNNIEKVPAHVHTTVQYIRTKSATQERHGTRA